MIDVLGKSLLKMSIQVYSGSYEAPCMHSVADMTPVQAGSMNAITAMYLTSRSELHVTESCTWHATRSFFVGRRALELLAGLYRCNRARNTASEHPTASDVLGAISIKLSS